MAKLITSFDLRCRRPTAELATLTVVPNVHNHHMRHRLIMRISRTCFMASTPLVLLLLLVTADVASNTPVPQKTSASYSTLTVRALLERANLTWSLLFREQQEALRGVKSLIEAKNMIECYAKHVQFNQQHKAAQLSSRTRTSQARNTQQRRANTTQATRTPSENFFNSSKIPSTTPNPNSVSSQPPTPTYLTNNGSFCVPDLMGGVCFPPHSTGTQYYYMCMDDLELRREILESCPAYNRYSEPAYAARQCSANATWSTTIDYDSTRSIMLPNGTIQPTLPCLALLERCYSTMGTSDKNFPDNYGTLGGEIGAPGDDLLTKQGGNDLKKHGMSTGAELAHAACSAKKSETVRQIATLVALLDLCFSSISFVLLCVTLFIFLFFKSLHCGRISIHTNLSASLLLRTALHIMFMAYKLFMDYSKRVREEENAAAAAEAAAAAAAAPPTPIDAGDMIESLGIGSIAAFVNDYDVELIAPYLNSSQALSHNVAELTTQSSAILDAVLTGANLLMSESSTHTLNATLALLHHHNTTYDNITRVMLPAVPPIWQMGDILCKSLLAIYMYATVASVLWMFIEGFHLSQRIALSVFRRETNFLLFYFIGWILPLLFVLAWVGAMELLTAQCYCWSNYDQSGWKWLVAGPMISALIVNAFFLIAIITIVITKLQANDTAEMAQVRKALKATIILFPLLGVSFLFSAFNPNDDGVGESAYYIGNAVLQGSQGIFVAVIYCFCNGEVHQAIKRYYYRILLRRGDYRRSSRIAMTLLDGNSVANATAAAERRKSSAAPLMTANVAPQHTLHNNHYGTEQVAPLTATTMTSPRQLNSTFFPNDVNHSDFNHVDANHTGADASTNHVVVVTPSSPTNSSHHSVSTPPPPPMFRYRLGSYAAHKFPSAAAPAAAQKTPVVTIAPLSASGTIYGVSDTTKTIGNGKIPSATDQAIADIDDDDDDEEEADENTAALKKLNNSDRETRDIEDDTYRHLQTGSVPGI